MTVNSYDCMAAEGRAQALVPFFPQMKYIFLNRNTKGKSSVSGA